MRMSMVKPHGITNTSLSVAAAMLQASSELGIPLEWGGLWKGFCDRPHFQLSSED